VIRGTICWVNLEDSHPPESGKTRPALVLSNSEQNAVLATVVVVPLSTKRPEIWPLRLALPPLPGLRKTFAVIPGIRQVSKTRLLNQAGLVPEEFLEALSEAVRAYLGD
jgi:mRNA interferase MazF